MKNKALVTSTTTTKSKYKKKGSKIRSKMKTKGFSTVIGEGLNSKKSAFKQKSKSTSKNKKGKLKTKSYAVNKDGSIKRSGDIETSSFVGNQIAAMEARGGEYRWSSFDVDKNTGQRVYIPLVGPDVPLYPYLMPNLSGYKVSDAEAKKKPGVRPDRDWETL